MKIISLSLLLSVLLRVPDYIFASAILCSSFPNTNLFLCLLHFYFFDKAVYIDEYNNGNKACCNVMVITKYIWKKACFPCSPVMATVTICTSKKEKAYILHFRYCFVSCFFWRPSFYLLDFIEVCLWNSTFC